MAASLHRKRSSELPCLLSLPKRDVTGYALAVREASWITKKYLGGQRRDRPHAGMGHQASRLRPLLRFLLDLAVQFVDRALQLWTQCQQRVALFASMRCQGQSPQRVLACSGPQAVTTPQPVTERQGLQAQLHAGADTHELIAVPQQNLQIVLLARRHPNRRKALFRQQREQQTRIASVVFLLAGFRRPDLCGMPDAKLDGQLFQ